LRQHREKEIYSSFLSKGRKKIKIKLHKECGGAGRAKEETALKTNRDDGGGSERKRCHAVVRFKVMVGVFSFFES
jgi:hypothetical protein